MAGWAPSPEHVRTACRALVRLGEQREDGPQVVMGQVVFARAVATCLLDGPEARLLLATADAVEDRLRVAWCARLGATTAAEAA